VTTSVADAGLCKAMSTATGGISAHKTHTQHLFSHITQQINYTYSEKQWSLHHNDQTEMQINGNS